MSIYKFNVKKINGEEISLEEYKGKVVLIVNTASECGFTPQYEDLEKTYNKYQDKGFVVLGFPSNQFGGQEPGSHEEIQSFCKKNYGVSFPLFEKLDVKGDNANPLYKYLVENAPFKGFDLKSPEGEFLNNHLVKNFPENLEGDDIKWNFTKFLIDRDGKLIDRYEPPVSPYDIEDEIENLL